MGIMISSLLWVVQDLYDQQYDQRFEEKIKGSVYQDNTDVDPKLVHGYLPFGWKDLCVHAQNAKPQTQRSMSLNISASPASRH